MYDMFFTLRNFEEKKSTAKFEQNLKKKYYCWILKIEFLAPPLKTEHAILKALNSYITQ